MDISFYIAASGAQAQQTRMNVIGNNMANLQTEGYKTISTGFVDLLYENYYKGGTPSFVPVTAEDPQTGTGTRVEKTDILFEQGGFLTTSGKYDYAIIGDGFFAVYDTTDGQVYYTRHGHFNLSNYGEDIFYLANEEGLLLLNRDYDLIQIDPSDEDQYRELPETIGVFDFAHKEGFLLRGNNRYEPVDKNGPPFLSANAAILQGKLEMANVDLAQEMTRVIESQRAYQLALRMMTTADEIENTINNLRG